MKLQFEVISKISESQKSKAKLMSVLNDRGVKFAKERDGDNLFESWRYPPLATIEINYSDANLLDAFCVGDIISLELTVAEPVKRKMIKGINSWN